MQSVDRQNIDRFGDYSSTYKAIKENIDNGRKSEACELIRGWNSRTIQELNEAVELKLLFLKKLTMQLGH